MVSKTCKLASLFGMSVLSLMPSFATVLTIDASGRSPGTLDQLIEIKAKSFAKNAAKLTRNQRLQNHNLTPLSMPISFRIVGNNSNSASRAPGDITLSFSSTGSRSFPTGYQTFLQDIYAQAKPVLDSVFGTARMSGTVKVLNYDADIGDRDAVAGGIYIHNGPTGREIRFPIYQSSNEVIAVNFIHTLLLAYLSDLNLPGDGLREGLVRAATMKIVRTPGALASTLDADAVESVLESTYDVGGQYDWNNQRALGAGQFIPENLRNVPIPDGISVGGLYLLRYQMAGSCFQKALIEYPQFAKAYLNAFVANPSQSVAQIGQTAINSLGGSGSTIEGESFAGWSQKQFILDATLLPGKRVLLQASPRFDGLSGNDFGVFNLQSHYFEVKANGDETLLKDTAYPIFWSPDFTRFFTAGQDDRMDILQGYGTITPNFPSTAFGGAPYRVTIDVPVNEVTSRVYVPAGNIARPGLADVSNVYGTITGVPRESGITYNVVVSSGFGSQTLPVQNFAFGGKVTFLDGISESRLTLQLVRVNGSVNTTILTKHLNKGRGGIGINLNVAPRLDTNLVLPGGISAIGSSIQLWRPDASSSLGLASNQVQFARWNPTFGKFQFYPDISEFGFGKGYFVRTNGAFSITRDGLAPREVAYVVPLIQGWNYVTCPQEFGIAVTDVEVITQSNSPVPMSTAIGATVGAEFYSYERAANNIVTGVSEQGTLVATSLFTPNSGLYLRCFDPKGATLVFYAPGSRSRTPRALMQTSGWVATAEVKAINGDRAIAKFGQAFNATNGFDKVHDSEFPASLGGMSLRVNGLGKDIRPLGPANTYQVTMSGLINGKTYSFNLSKLQGLPPKVFLYDPITRKNLKLTLPASYNFTATESTRSIRINSVKI